MNKIIDITKPIRCALTGAAARIVASGLTGPIPGVKATYSGGETLLIAEGDGALDYAYADGKINRDGVILYENVIVRTSEFRNFNSRGQGGVQGRMALGGTPFRSLGEARRISFINGEGTLELIREGDKLVDVKFHPKA